jgi:hypothetical protein
MPTVTAGKENSARAATDPNGPTGRLATWLANTTLDTQQPDRHPRSLTTASCLRGAYGSHEG